MSESDDQPGGSLPSAATAQGGSNIDNRGAVIGQQIFVQRDAKFGTDAPTGGSEPGRPTDEMLARHRDHLVRQLSPVKILRNIARNKAGHGQGNIRLQDVFVCPRLIPQEVQDRLEALDRHLLDPTSGRDRSSSAEYGEQVRWEPERWASSSTSVGRALERHRALMVVGDPGSGKSTLLAALALATVSERSSREFTEDPSDVSLYGRVPFYLRLPELAPRAQQGVPDLRRALAESTPVLASPELVEHTLRNERVVVLLDALDEVPSSRARDCIADAIESLCRTYPEILVVVTTREGGRTLIPGFTAVHLSPMTRHDAGRFISVWRKALGKTKVLESLPPGKVEALGELGRNPLMLIIILLTGDIDLPQNERVLFYRRALQTMVTTWRGSSDDEHDPATKQAWRAWGEVALGLRYDDSGGLLPRSALELRLSEALAAQGAADAEALASRMVDRAWRESGLLTTRGDELGFWHSTFGEYLAATALARDVTLERFVALRRDHRNIEVAVMTIDYLAYVERNEVRASEYLRALLESRDPWDDLDGVQLGFAVECVRRGCYACAEDVDRYFEVVLRLSQEFPYHTAHRRCFSRLVHGLPRHTAGCSVLSVLADVASREKPSVELDVVAALVSSAGSRGSAMATCETLLRCADDGLSWPDRTPQRRAWAALGLVAGGRLEPRLLEPLTGLPWFDEPRHGRHGLSAEDLRAEARDGTFVGASRRALGISERRVLMSWARDEEVADRASVCLLLALSSGAMEPEDFTVSSLIHAATHEQRSAVRENAREMLGRLALRHSRVVARLLEEAYRAGPDAHARVVVGTQRESDPRNWSQKLLGRVASASSAILTGLMDEVARAAFQSRVEQHDDLSLPLLRHLLHDVEGAGSAFEAAILRRSGETEHWPRLAAFGLLLGRSDRASPHPTLWLACIRSEDPWHVLVALECWHPHTWERRAVTDEIIDGFVGACDRLWALGPHSRPEPDEVLAGLSKTRGVFLADPGAFGRRSPRRSATARIRDVLSGRGTLAAQVAAAIARRLTQADAASPTILAALLAEHGGTKDHPEIIDMLRAGLVDHDVEAAAEAAVWLVRHDHAVGRPPADELQWAMLEGSTYDEIIERTELIRQLGPPSDSLLVRMIEGEHTLWTRLERDSAWIFSNPRALDVLVDQLHDGASARQCRTVVDLLRTDPDNESIDAALYARAQDAPPEACVHIIQALECRRVERADDVADPRIDELRVRALASRHPASLLYMLESLRGWSKDDREAITRAYRICLGAQDAMTRIYAVSNLIRWTSPSSPLSDVLPRFAAVEGLTLEEIIASVEWCLDVPTPYPRLFAASILLGISASPGACERTLRALATSDDELSVEFGLEVELSVVRAMARSLVTLLERPEDVFRAVLGNGATLGDAASLLLWMFFAGPLPQRIHQMFRELGDPAVERGWPSSRDPSGAASILARCSRAHIREPVRRAMIEVLRAGSETTVLRPRDALQFLEEPGFLDPLMEWCLQRTEFHRLSERAEDLRELASERPNVMPRIAGWLRDVSTAPTIDPSNRSQAAVCLAALLGIEDGASCRAWLVLMSTGQSYHGLSDEHVEYLRAHWHELPLGPGRLLELVRRIELHQPHACPDVCASIISNFLASDDPEVKLDALDVWWRWSRSADHVEVARRAWRDLDAAAAFPYKGGACSLAIALIEHDPTAEDLVRFLKDCTRDRELSIHDRLHSLSTIESLPAERAWAEATARGLLAASEGRDLEVVAGWFLERIPADAEEIPLDLARVMVRLCSAGWSPSSLANPGRWGSNDHRSVPLTGTHFDRTFVQIFAELLHEDAGTLLELFDGARGNAIPSSEQRADVLRILRVRPSDDRPTRYARRWWYHRLRADPRAS